MDRLSETEQRLVTAVDEGTVLDLSEAADRAVRGDVLRNLLRGVLATAPDPRGIRLTGATITGSLDLTGLRTELPLALVACEVAEPIVLEQARLAGVRLDGCTVGRIDALRLHTDGGVVLDGLRCTGGINLSYAEIDGTLSLQRARLDGGTREALMADGITVTGNVVLTTGFHARSASSQGTVRLPAARIGGQLRLSGADLHNGGGGAALLADSAHVAMSIILSGIRAESDGADATIRLIRTHTDSMLYLDRANLRNPSGPALNATALRVAADLWLGPRFEAHAHTSVAAVRLTAAHVQGQLRAERMLITNTVDDAPVLDLARTTVDGPLWLPVGQLIGGGTPFLVTLDGLTYRSVPVSASAGDWLTMLRDHTPGYAAQPYQQLAAVHRAAGHERDTRRILIAQQRDLGARGQLGGVTARLWHRTSGVALGYGYRPIRALAGLLVSLLLACLFVLVAGGAGDTTRTSGPAREPCSVTEHLSLAADLSVPVVSLGAQEQCRLAPTTSAAQWYVVAGWVTTLLGWSFATLFVAGFTGLVRKT